MARRLFNGNAFSEDGWPYVDEAGCTWVTVPGTNPPVHLEIQSGPPSAIMGAVAADFNAFIEPLRDPDSASWTPGNSVATSNHPGGTAMDLNWDSHKFQVEGTFSADQQAVIAQVIDFYEGMIGWAGPGYWPGGPVDEMHWQMGYGTYDTDNDRVDPKVADFISRKIRSDGFSTFRRDNAVPLPPPPPPVPSNAADVLSRATGITIDKANEILPGVLSGLHDSQCTNVRRVAMWLAQLGEESGSFVYTEEIASGAEYEGRADLGNTQPGDGERYKGRSWIQITGRGNYARLSQWAATQGIVPSVTYFVDNPEALAEIQYAGTGPAWYWTVARPQINSLCDEGNLVAVTQAINGGQHGAADRQDRYDRAMALGDQLLALITDTPAQGEDELSAEDSRKIDVIYQELTKKFASRSPLRHLGEGPIDTMAGFVLNTDGSEHVEVVRLLAGYGHPDTLALLREVATADPVQYPDRQGDAKIAEAILAEVTNAPMPPPPAAAAVAQAQAPVVMAPVATLTPPPPATSSTGQIIGQAYDALENLQNSGVLTGDENAPLKALIGVLQNKTQAQGAPAA